MKRIVAIVGARPQFIKHAPVELAMRGRFEIFTIHTGQHYDHQMSQVFFEELGLSTPKYNLNVGSASQGMQTARMMIDLEPVLKIESPDYVLVYGDTNSTLAGALTSAKLQIPVIHVEAGLRSFNRTMPEEINRVITDHLSAVMFTPTERALENLRKEGITRNVFNIGDVMLDMLRISERHGILGERKRLGFKYCFATIHRPYNTDDDARMVRILAAFENLPLRVFFAVHPRTFKRIQNIVSMESFKNIYFSEPLSYFDSVSMLYGSEVVITDSGGLQKEAYFIKKKCITLRSETEWQETLKNGWNTLLFEDIEGISKAIEIVPGEYVNGLFGDGRAAEKLALLLN